MPCHLSIITYFPSPPPTTIFFFSINPISDHYLVSAMQSRCLVLVFCVMCLCQTVRVDDNDQVRKTILECCDSEIIYFSNSASMGGCGSSMARFLFDKFSTKFEMSNFSSLGGGGVTEAKLEKAHMTHDDWMALTNRPDVVEKDMVKLLDWFIKVDSTEDDVVRCNFFLIRTIHLVEFPNFSTKISSPPPRLGRGWLRSCSEYWTMITEGP